MAAAGLPLVRGVGYDDIGGASSCTPVQKLREIVERQLRHPERYAAIGIEPSRGTAVGAVHSVERSF